MSDRATARAFGALFVLMGILGFIPGVASHAQLLGEFRVSNLLNVVHLLLGAIAIVFARPIDLALGSLGLWLVGVFAAGGWLSLDTAENWLHFVVGVGLLALTAVSGRVPVRSAV
ncbi:MAG TPA: DUF4383 domain-containing protein [Gaiellaceae bacterium]|nr:DUF4383 domain-containing protein [Gaiellaceae bacterium]